MVIFLKYRVQLFTSCCGVLNTILATHLLILSAATTWRHCNFKFHTVHFVSLSEHGKRFVVY